MALLSGEVETGLARSGELRGLAVFRMALLSGEVETASARFARVRSAPGSGWLCYPGKLKLLFAVNVDDWQAIAVPDGFAIRGS